MKLQNMKRGETTEQIALFNWAMRSTHVLPCLSLMYHVPNEGKRTNGPVLKAMGMKMVCRMCVCQWQATISMGFTWK
jgi:hypothetical protein